MRASYRRAPLARCSAADIEWKIIYVGSAETEDKDQELESIMVGPVPVGTCKFVFEVSTPLLRRRLSTPGACWGPLALYRSAR